MGKQKTHLPFFERPDLSPFLVHLTRNSKRTNGNSAFKNLISILQDGHIRSSGKEGYVKGKNRATCFMDAPLSSLKYVLNERDTSKERTRYQPYGIVVTKKIAYKKGCRPVLYLSDSELDDLGIPENEVWRVVNLNSVDGTGVNWIHEREWRCKGKFILPKSSLAVLVKNSKEATKLKKLIDKDGSKFKSIPISIIPLSILCQGLPYLAK